LQFDVEPAPGAHTTIRQTAIFDPLGLGGMTYWYGLFPAHALVFGRMIRAIGRAADSKT
jgi:hypothetical protein